VSESQEPREAQAREAWSEVGRRFEELGRTLREHFGGRDSATWRAADNSAGPDDESAGEAGAASGRAAVQDAVRRFGEAAQRLGDQASDAVRDPAVRETAQRATRSLADALESTFGQLGEQLRSRAASRSPGSGGSDTGGSDTGGSDTGGSATGGSATGGSATGGTGTSGAAGAAGDPGPQSIPGPHPDPEPGGAATRPPADS
jgi:hypothetical protein